MLRRFAAVCILGMLAACHADDTHAPLTGQQVYAQTCAECHDAGLDGAPRTGEPEDWADRSMLWEAVLFEHANKGHLEMPAKGGDPSLDDAAVARAAEYMLTQTFPDALKD